MNSAGAALSGKNRLLAAQEEERQERWRSAVARSHDEFRRDRPYKVSLCVMIVSEVEVVGNILTVDHLAVKCTDEARVTLHTAPAAFRFHVQKRSDPKNPESPLEWVEVVHSPVDPNDGNSPWAWQLKR